MAPGHTWLHVSSLFGFRHQTTQTELRTSSDGLETRPARLKEVFSTIRVRHTVLCYPVYIRKRALFWHVSFERGLAPHDAPHE